MNKMSKTASYLACFLALLFFSSVSSFSAERYILIILDNSGSMRGWKIQAAKRFITDLTGKLSPNVEIGVRVFGKTGSDQCDSSHLAAEFSTIRTKEEKREFVEKLRKIQVRGKTPLAHALEEARYDFYGVEKENIVMLITDGNETCGGDPCVVSNTLRKYYGIEVNVIGIDMKYETRQELKCIADSGGGIYYDAKNEFELKNSIEQVAKLPTVPLIIKLFDKNGEKLYGHIEIEDEYYNTVASTDEDLHEFSPTLTVGTYSVIAEYGGYLRSIDVSLREEEPEEIVFSF